MERLVRLRDQGALSSEEFIEQKRILLEGQSAELSTVDVRTGFTRSPLRKVSIAALLIGGFMVLYATFIYDTTISPLDASNAYSSVDTTSSLEERARAIDDLNDRIQRTMAGERVINLPRVVEQQRIFSFGALLMILGVMGYLIPLIRQRG